MLMHNSIRVRLETSIQLADYFFSPGRCARDLTFSSFSFLSLRIPHSVALQYLNIHISICAYLHTYTCVHWLSSLLPITLTFLRIRERGKSVQYTVIYSVCIGKKRSRRELESEDRRNGEMSGGLRFFSLVPPDPPCLSIHPSFSLYLISLAHNFHFSDSSSFSLTPLGLLLYFNQLMLRNAYLYCVVFSSPSFSLFRGLVPFEINKWIFVFCFFCLPLSLESRPSFFCHPTVPRFNCEPCSPSRRFNEILSLSCLFFLHITANSQNGLFKHLFLCLRLLKPRILKPIINFGCYDSNTFVEEWDALEKRVTWCMDEKKSWKSMTVECSTFHETYL